jgi:endonuclease/exonuclease/phosphatase family metal-dependent hydrolase
VAAWNIETGAELDLIRLAFTTPSLFAEAVAKRNAAVSKDDRADDEDIAGFRPQADHLAKSDVIILNEVDVGMPRSGYRDVARDLATAAGMDYAFGVEFVEVDKLHLGIEPLPDAGEPVEQIDVDRRRYRGLQGTAVLSRYPIRSARNLRLKECYDWYGKEKYYIDNLVEQGRRRTAKEIFLERISREVRHGNRFALIVDLDVPESPTGKVTVVAAHLENKSRPSCRREQMEEILTEVRRIRNPVILGGDLNTSGTDTAPTSVGRELRKRVRSPNFWASQAIQWLGPVPFANLMLSGVRYVKNYRDPTARGIPLVAANRDAPLFDKVEEFRFYDAGRFDFSGDKERSANGRDGKLANSNERSAKGFHPTLELNKDYQELAGQMRLDWLLIKPVARGGQCSAHFAPWHGRTLEHLNESAPERISDHHPITVDLALRPQL